MFVPLFTKFSLSNGHHMFTAWPYWFSLVHANYRPIVTYRPDQGNQLCTIEIRAKLGGYQLQTSFLPSALPMVAMSSPTESQLDVMQSRWGGGGGGGKCSHTEGGAKKKKGFHPKEGARKVLPVSWGGGGRCSKSFRPTFFHFVGPPPLNSYVY